LSSSSSEAEEVTKCIMYKIEGPYIVLINKCEETFRVRSLDVRYYITVTSKTQPVTEDTRLSAKKDILERVKLNKKLEAGSKLDVYFGPVGNIAEVYVLVERGRAQYRVRIKQLVERKEGE